MAPPRSPPSHLLFAVDSHKGAVHTAVYNTGSSYILTGGADRQVRLTNAKTGAEIKSYGGHGYEVLGLAWCVGSLSFLCLSSFSGRGCVWGEGCSCTGPLTSASSSCSTHDNTRFASCGGDRSVFVWDVTSGDILRRLSGHVGKVNAVAWNREASVLASGPSPLLVPSLKEQS